MNAWTRRRFFSALGGGSALLAAGCNTPPVNGPFLPACGLPANVPGDVTIDVHTHIFNARDLQVELFLTKAVAPAYPVVVGELIAALAPLLQAAGWDFAPD